MISTTGKDLIGNISMLSGFYYTLSIVCPTYLPLLAQCCQLINKDIEDLHNCIKNIWEYLLLYNNFF